MSSENTRLWDMLGRTDPAHTKGFKRGGGFSGTAIKPIWSYRRMTEEFGPCGTGWGIGSPDFQVLPGADGETLVYCTVSVWYDKKDQIVWGVGGDKVIAKFSSGAKSDDEAFKKAFTDAITNALKLIGVGADVHMGLFEDSKYVAEMRGEFAEPAKPPSRSSAALKREDVWPEFQREVEECESTVALASLASAWSAKADTDKWPIAWREAAKEEINKRRTAILSQDDDTFPGDRPSPTGNRYADNVLAG